MTRYIPETPGGSTLANLEADTEIKAWANLLKETVHMYPDIKALKARGYKVIPYASPKKKKGKR